MPRRTGWWEEAASFVAGELWTRGVRAGVRLEVLKRRADKEVVAWSERYGYAVVVKIAERRHPIPPSLLWRYAVAALKHGKEYAGRVAVVVVLRGRPTLGSLRLITGRLRWASVVWRLESIKALARFALDKIAEQILARVYTRELRALAATLQNISKKWFRALSEKKSEKKKHVYRLKPFTRMRK